MFKLNNRLQRSVFAVFFIMFTLSAILMSGFFVNTAKAATTNLGVGKITAIRTFANADGTYENGWKWVFNVTVPDGETGLKIKFADWTGTSGSISAADNIRVYSDQSTNADDSNPIVISFAGVYSSVMELNTGIDLDSDVPDRQIQIYLEAKVPSTAGGGSYSTTYGIKTGDTTLLDSAITSAQTKNTDAVEGTNAGQYATGSKSTLLSAITSAISVRDSSSSTQANINSAVTTLNSAISTFDAGKVAVSLQSISITTPATKLIYAVGDSLNTDGLVVTGSYNDSTTKVETVDSVTGFDSSSPVVDQVLTVTVGEKTITYTVTIKDVTASTVSAVYISSNNILDSAKAKVGDIVTLTFTASEVIQTPNVTIAGNTGVPLEAGADNSWTATYVMQSSDTEGLVAFTITPTDLADNVGDEVTTTSNVSSSVTFDKTAPVITVTSYNTNPTNQNITVNATSDTGSILNASSYTFRKW